MKSQTKRFKKNAMAEVPKIAKILSSRTPFKRIYDEIHSMILELENKTPIIKSVLKHHRSASTSLHTKDICLDVVLELSRSDVVSKEVFSSEIIEIIFDAFFPSLEDSPKSSTLIMELCCDASRKLKKSTIFSFMRRMEDKPIIYYPKEIRLCFYKIVSFFIENCLEDINNDSFLHMFINLMNGEKDPACLLEALKAHYIINSSFSHSLILKNNIKLFEIVSCYFPLSYEPTEESLVTENELSSALKNSLASSEPLAVLSYDFLLKKICDFEGEFAKGECFDVFNKILKKHSFNSLKNYFEPTFNVVLKQLSSFDGGKDNDLYEKISKTIKIITGKIFGSKSFLKRKNESKISTKIIEKCIQEIEQMYSNRALQCSKLLKIMALSHKEAKRKIFESVWRKSRAFFLSHKEQESFKELELFLELVLGILLSFSSERSSLQKKFFDRNVLEEMWSIFLSGSIGGSPDMRSISIASLTVICEIYYANEKEETIKDKIINFFKRLVDIILTDFAISVRYQASKSLNQIIKNCSKEFIEEIKMKIIMPFIDRFTKLVDFSLDSNGNFVFTDNYKFYDFQLSNEILLLEKTFVQLSKIISFFDFIFHKILIIIEGKYSENFDNIQMENTKKIENKINKCSENSNKTHSNRLLLTYLKLLEKITSGKKSSKNLESYFEKFQKFTINFLEIYGGTNYIDIEIYNCIGQNRYNLLLKCLDEKQQNILLDSCNKLLEIQKEKEEKTLKIQLLYLNALILSRIEPSEHKKNIFEQLIDTLFALYSNLKNSENSVVLNIDPEMDKTRKSEIQNKNNGNFVDCFEGLRNHVLGVFGNYFRSLNSKEKEQQLRKGVLFKTQNTNFCVEGFLKALELETKAFSFFVNKIIEIFLFSFCNDGSSLSRNAAVKLGSFVSDCKSFGALERQFLSKRLFEKNLLSVEFKSKENHVKIAKHGVNKVRNSARNGVKSPDKKNETSFNQFLAISVVLSRTKSFQDTFGNVPKSVLDSFLTGYCSFKCKVFPSAVYEALILLLKESNMITNEKTEPIFNVAFDLLKNDDYALKATGISCLLRLSSMPIENVGCYSEKVKKVLAKTLDSSKRFIRRRAASCLNKWMIHF